MDQLLDVAREDRIVLDGLRAPFGVLRGIAGDAKLNHKVGHDTEEGRTVIESICEQRRQVRGAERCPSRRHVYHNKTGRRAYNHIRLKRDRVVSSDLGGVETLKGRLGMLKS